MRRTNSSQKPERAGVEVYFDPVVQIWRVSKFFGLNPGSVSSRLMNVLISSPDPISRISDSATSAQTMAALIRWRRRPKLA